MCGSERTEDEEDEAYKREAQLPRVSKRGTAVPSRIGKHPMSLFPYMARLVNFSDLCFQFYFSSIGIVDLERLAENVLFKLLCRSKQLFCSMCLWTSERRAKISCQIVGKMSSGKVRLLRVTGQSSD